MLISICIPCMNRTYDLRKTLPKVFEAANFSPPVEIVLVNYNSKDDLDEYIENLDHSLLSPDNLFTYIRHNEGDFYHMAKARNLAAQEARGKYIVVSSADIWPAKTYFVLIRYLLRPGVVWMRPARYGGVIVCKRSEFLASGGFDERFEFYGPEDKDLEERLTRRGGKFKVYPWHLLNVIDTPRPQKYENYRITNRKEIKKRMHPIYKENKQKKVLVVNA